MKPKCETNSILQICQIANIIQFLVTKNRRPPHWMFKPKMAESTQTHIHIHTYEGFKHVLV